MKIGVVFPQIEFPSDAAAIRDYAQTVEGLGFTHILAYDHVLGANPDRPEGWKGPYTYKNQFQELFTLFSFWAGATQRIEFASGILILPQRQTALVAKQAAQVDLFSGGRFRLGVGNGWNEVEYTSLNEDFHNRGKRMEEQIEVLRLLWKQPLVTYQGKWHTIPDAGIEPRPMQGSIPIWFGGHAEPVLQRMVKLGDGWMTGYRKPEDAKPMIDHISELLAASGRSWGTDFGLESRPHVNMVTPDEWPAFIENWAAHHATHLSINTMDAGFTTPQQHLDALTQFAEHIGLKA
jgi:probable F420-dependent oxidoreductase